MLDLLHLEHVLSLAYTSVCMRVYSMWNLESGSWIVKWSRILNQLDSDFRKKSAIFKKLIETQLKWANNGHNFKISVFQNLISQRRGSESICFQLSTSVSNSKYPNIILFFSQIDPRQAPWFKNFIQY